jgi:hypothetical protein
MSEEATPISAPPPTFGKQEPVSDATSNGKPRPGRLSLEDLADRTKFRFREETLEIPEIGGTIQLRSLSVKEREDLPNPGELAEVDDKGERTKRAVRAAAETFSIIVSDPKVTADQAEQFLGDWPVEAFDRITAAYAKLVGSEEEITQAADRFQD